MRRGDSRPSGRRGAAGDEAGNAAVPLKKAGDTGWPSQKNLNLPGYQAEVHTTSGFEPSELWERIRGHIEPTLIPLAQILLENYMEKLAYGENLEQLKKDCPFICQDDIRAALLYAAKRLAHEEIFAV